MKKWALLLTITGPILSAVSVKFLLFTYPQGQTPDSVVLISVPFMVLGFISLFIGPTLFAFHLPDKKRRTIANIILGTSILFMFSGVALEFSSLGGAGQALITGILMFSFSYGTLALKNKYEKWKVYTRSGRASFLLSLTDSVGLATLFIGIMFRLMHWPLASAFMMIGVFLIVVGMIAWNQRFKKEVVYRKETEDKLQLSYKQLEEKQREITDSITYAKRIQQSLLAHDEFLAKNLPEHFVLYLPKDIVSGDFYWCTVAHNSVYLAVCDSTGHGVPGAFMSLLNISFLNEAINEKNISAPEKVLDYVRKKLIANISQEGAKDGMDGILLRIETGTGKLTYAAANCAPVLVAQAVSVDLPCDKMPIGIGERMNPFSLHNVDASPGSVLYLFTDGYADQFGGEKGKKFKRGQLKEKLATMAIHPMNEQQQQLKEIFQQWQGSLEQIDDVCIIGIRL